MSSEPKKCVSLVAPCYNEEAVVDAFLDRVRPIASELSRYEFEFFFVDDGSRDATLGILQERAQSDDRIRVVSLSRNFGHQRAITAGLDFCTGDFIIVIDADLQDPPELIPRILELLTEGYDLVHTVREDRRSDSFAKRVTARLFYAGMRRGILPELPENAGDFKGFNREVLKVFRQYRERVRFLRGIFATLGFRQTTLGYTRPPRAAGKSKYPWRSVLRLARDAVVSYSVLPLRAGIVVGTISLAALPFYVLWALLFGSMGNPGEVLLTSLVIGFGGLSSLLLGVVGEYLGCVIREVKGRPLYVVRTLVNASREDTAEGAGQGADGRRFGL